MEQRGPADAADGGIDVSDNVKEKKRKNVVRSKKRHVGGHGTRYTNIT
jgi:hypothetical protein